MGRLPELKPVSKTELSSLPRSYDEACICLSGHIITDFARAYPKLVLKHCRRCGNETITKCPACGHPILGGLWIGSKQEPLSHPPGFCSECGTAFPWIRTALDAVRAAAQDDGSITAEETDLLMELLPEVTRNPHPNSELIKRLRNLLSNAGSVLVKSVVELGAQMSLEALFQSFLS